MLFLVLSDPRPDHPSSMTEARQRYWAWVDPLIAAGTVRSAYARVGRGVAATFDVDSIETLHRLLNEWAEIIPARFDIHPLIDQASARRFLGGQSNG